MGDAVERLIKLGKLERSPGDDDNWVERAGKLPAYIERVANSIHTKRGLPISQSIAIAIDKCKEWASGRGEVNADTRAKAAKAVAQWEALKGKNKAKKAAK